MNVLEKYKAYENKTFADAAALYLAEFTGKDKKRQEYALNQVLPFTGHLNLMEINDESLWEYMSRRSREAMVGTIRKELIVVNTVLNKAARVWRWIPAVPVIQKPTGPTRESYPLSQREQRRLLFRLRGDVRQIALFVLNTGVKRAEIFRLRWEDQRTRDNTDYFYLREPNYGRERPVVLNRVSRKAVDTMKGRDPEFVFPHRDVSKPINRAWVKVGLPNHPLIRKGINNL